jgi:phosphoribosylaminoimidazolecarboxamide formyltransferase/IMP cyclohydrolase
MAERDMTRRRRALLSVTDKEQLEDVAVLLHSFDYELIASGGTAAYLREHGFTVSDVSALTGFPEIFGGRVKTLHPAILGGILGPSLEDFAALPAELAIEPIDVVVVNLYPFEKIVARGAEAAVAIENIDVGGPALLRAAAKNHDRVTVLTDPRQYEEFLHELRANEGATSPGFRRRLAAAAFRCAAAYDAGIARWFEARAGTTAAGGIELRYGENPHQRASLELPSADPDDGGPLAALGLIQHGGKVLSYNNIVDLVAALKLAADFEEPCCAVIKHTNPCGLGLGPAAESLERALLCDPISAFGGVFAFNTPVSAEAADVLAGRFLEIVVAPEYEPDVLERLTRKKNVRVMSCDGARFGAATTGRSRAYGRLVLHQDEDTGFPELDDARIAAGEAPDAETWRALGAMWRVAKHGKSNAVVLGNATGTLGCGFGQMSRVDSVKLAIRKAGEQDLELAGSVAASDGFFPFPDGIRELAAAGVAAVIAPGGSIRDDEVAAAAQELGVTLVLASRRHFNH